MALLAEIQQILDLKNPSVTELRRYSKETLIDTIIEMKKTYSSEAVILKELEIKSLMVTKELEEKKQKYSITEKLMEFSELMKDHQFGPAAIGHVSTCVSNVFSENPVPFNSNSSDDLELESRVDRAREQGMKWNSSDKRPNKTYTIRKKVEQWESGYERGLNESLSICSTDSVDEIFRRGEPYVTGLCKQMEDKLGIGPSSKYLKTRFKRNLDRLTKESIVTPPPASTKPKMSVDEHVDEMYKRVWGDSLEGDAKKNDRIRVIGNLRREFTRCDGDLTSFRRDIIKNSSYHTSLPVFIVYEEKEHDSDNSRSRDVIDNKYNDQIEKFLEEYVNEFEGK